MSGPFHEAAYPSLQAQDFGPAKPFRVEVHNRGRTIVIGDYQDLGFQKTPTYVLPTLGIIDVVIHGLPGRFIEKLAGHYEIPVPVVALLIETQGGVRRGTPLRLLTCHASEVPANGPTNAHQLAAEWGGTVSGPNGLLRIGRGTLRVDLVEWDPGPVFGGMMPTVVGQGQGTWLLHVP